MHYEDHIQTSKVHHRICLRCWNCYLWPSQVQLSPSSESSKPREPKKAGVVFYTTTKCGKKQRILPSFFPVFFFQYVNIHSQQPFYCVPYLAYAEIKSVCLSLQQPSQALWEIFIHHIMVILNISFHYILVNGISNFKNTYICIIAQVFARTKLERVLHY